MSPLAPPTSPPPDVHLRTALTPGDLRPGDLEALSALTQTSRTAVIGPGLMQDLLEAGDDEGTVMIIAEGSEGAVGYVHLETSPRGPEAWLVSGAVDPQARQRGIGSALLSAAVEIARGREAPSLQISGRPHGYAVPGVDADADPDTATFLGSRGASAGGAALAMHRTLHDLDPAAPVVQAPSGSSPSPTLRPCQAEDLPELYDVVREHLAADWAETFESFAESGGPIRRILISRGVSGELLGVACWGVVGRDPARFGPFGVVPSARGQGAGGALLDAALLHMAGEGLGHAWFQWTGPDSPAHRLYISRGFTPLRTFTPYTVPTDHVDVITAQEGTTR